MAGRAGGGRARKAHRGFGKGELRQTAAETELSALFGLAAECFELGILIDGYHAG